MKLGLLIIGILQFLGALATVWLGFFLHDYLDMKPYGWYAIPYVFTCYMTFFGLVVGGLTCTIHGLSSS